MEIISFIGFLLPPLIDLVNKRIKDSDAKFWISVGICSLVGIGVSYFNFGGWAPINIILAEIFVVFGTAQITYKGVYQESKLQTKIRG